MGYFTVRVRNEELRYLRLGKGKPLLFLHGFGVAPHHYRALLELLAQRYDILAPSLIGMNYLKNPPVTIADCRLLLADFSRALDVTFAFTVGHSLGGVVALQQSGVVIALNIPSQRLPFSLLKRNTLRKTRMLLLGAQGWPGIRMSLFLAVPFLMNYLKNPAASRMLIADLPQLPVVRTATILYGADDELFGPCKLPQAKVLQGLPHDWPICLVSKVVYTFGQFLNAFSMAFFEGYDELQTE